jgi:hypothetical protein
MLERDVPQNSFSENKLVKNATNKQGINTLKTRFKPKEKLLENVPEEESKLGSSDSDVEIYGVTYVEKFETE